MQSAVARIAKHRHLHFFLLDLLADVLGRPADHQAGDEHADDRVEQHAVEARADAAEDHFAGLDVEHRHEAAERREAVVPAVDRAAARIGCDRRKQSDVAAMPNRVSFALHVAARLPGVAALSMPSRASVGFPACSAPYATNAPIRNMHGHR